MVKKILPFIIVAIIASTIFFIGKRSFYKNKYPWEHVLEVQLERYYSTRDEKELDAIINLYKTYSFDEEIMGKIQSKTDTTVNGWYDYIGSKYICDLTNANTCSLYKSDLDELVNNTIKKMYLKSYENYNVVSWDNLNLLNKRYEQDKMKIEEIEKNPNRSRQKDYEQLRKEKCAAASECGECKNGLCQCTYIDQAAAKKEFVFCKEEKKDATTF